ncbi:ubiquinol-cytochrome c reductase complex assembly factor 1 isoform 3-T3 [Lycaon pictus]|uniref:ubiquinol-cytochrome-c reductase complex assembly factor 1 isoform X4 n=1 Tax=Canis lupus familiaris TaxID=9615 RepID=UPI0003ADBD2F|nr:ubiquinol-cytochrome-c reductase complex assembly factor 1 isoform X4 [Canis lupus familiaris]XP_025325621.1 ubiquinol-cytochrome-c reductase complex assembly factor 1 isoform X4 [Canis lupus dingo]XP_038289546.1 ubiquinol-cytochrome-c reductase complex assembly factor 1 isoform X4 [Canis lupus familiaris]XP_038428034.1 ubiquinol-cytochrome-c reductase complex assembly factor 1 isoform X4 [Canis lupus familiaris]|eukprot:XP_005635028.1 ubiquinol-cytochrome-c reductase complex assembly factor 1 isoform X4 [Canis lupus familiaris]
MALLVRVLRNRINISQWFPVCSRLVPVSSTQGKWGRALSGTFQWSPMSQFLGCGRSEQIPGVGVQWSRKYHTTNKLSTTKDSPQPVEEKVGAFTKIIEAMGFTGPLKYSKWKIKIAALRMYTSCVEKTDFEEFFLRCQMPDTFNSWFLITLLHVWMCLVRMKQEGRSGKYMCRIIVHFMWEDVEQRGRVMGMSVHLRWPVLVGNKHPVNSYILKKNMILMTNNFYAAILGYDEGILSDDHGLAAALWRTFFNQKCEDPRQLELLVEYVRKQMQYLDSMNGEDLLLTGEVSWRPLVEKNPQSILKPHSPTYNDEGL